MKLPKRLTDVRVEITKRVFGEYARRYHLNKGTVIDGRIDGEGNFRFKQAESETHETIIYPSYYKVIGRFYLRKVK